MRHEVLGIKGLIMMIIRFKGGRTIAQVQRPRKPQFGLRTLTSWRRVQTVR